MRRSSVLLMLAAAVQLTACGGGESTDQVARAADHHLTVSEAVDILSQGSNLPNWSDAAREMANLWVDYTLLAKAAAEDTTMSQLDVSPMVSTQVEQVILTALRDSMVKVDPGITDQQRRSRALAAAESVYVAKIERQAQPRITDGAADVVRQLARDPEMKLDERARNRPLVTYEGGMLTVEEVRQFLETRPPPFRRQIADQAQDSLIDSGVLDLLTRRELLVAEARRQGWQVKAEDREPLVSRSRQIVRSTARELGLFSIEPASGQTQAQAIDKAVKELLVSIVKGERNATNMGAVSYVLREHYPADVSQSGVDQVVARMVATR